MSENIQKGIGDSGQSDEKETFKMPNEFSPASQFQNIDKMTTSTTPYGYMDKSTGEELHSLFDSYQSVREEYEKLFKAFENLKKENQQLKASKESFAKAHKEIQDQRDQELHSRIEELQLRLEKKNELMEKLHDEHSQEFAKKLKEKDEALKIVCAKMKKIVKLSMPSFLQEDFSISFAEACDKAAAPAIGEVFQDERETDLPNQRLLSKWKEENQEFMPTKKIYL